MDGTNVVYDAYLASGRTVTASIVEEVGRFHVLVRIWDDAGVTPRRKTEDEILVLSRAVLSNRRIMPPAGLAEG